MRTGDLLFIFIILILACVGGIAVMASQNTTTTVKDSFGGVQSAQGNTSQGLIQNTSSYEETGMGLGIILVAVIIIIVIVLGIMMVLRKNKIGGNRYRT